MRLFVSSPSSLAVVLFIAGWSIVPLTHVHALEAPELVSKVKIYRDAWGVPHIDGETDAAAVFGCGYAQAEDHFWQIEDNYILALGRYSEIYGEKEYRRDVRNRAFEIVSRSRKDFAEYPAEFRAIAEAYVGGLNWYLEKHPETKPRLIERFEPWHMLAFVRTLTLEFCFRKARVPKKAQAIWSQRGSNAWSVAGSRTKSGRPMLYICPHQPWYGIGQFYEGHMRSGEGWNFTGAMFLGVPLPSLGHNEHAGWAFTVNQPDVADTWRVTFDHPDDPLKYRYDGGWRRATEWKDTVRVKTALGVEDREITLRKTHHGPVVAKDADSDGGGTHLVARVARLYEAFGAEQALALLRVRNVDDFKKAMALRQFPIFNCVYADRSGTIYYLYNGAVPKRDPAFDWRRPVDGSDPRTEWQGFHGLGDLPQIENPPCGWLQNCNQSPFKTLDEGNLDPSDFPSYMVEDRDSQKRRALISRKLLRDARELTLDQFEDLTFDTTIYWASTELPKLARELDRITMTHPEVAEKARPYFDHFDGWDSRVRVDCTRSTLCVAWYEELYGQRTGESMKKQFVEAPHKKFEALVRAAKGLEKFHGGWKVAYGDVFRLQRCARVSDFFKLPFSDKRPSVPHAAAAGPLGVAFTVYSMPSLSIPFVGKRVKRYGIVGASYQSVVEFGDRIEGRSLVPYGSSGDPDSPHFFDQAKLMSRREMKRQLFYWDDVRREAKSVYRPGEEVAAKGE